MENIIYQALFFIATIYFLFKVIGFAIYEIHELNNKAGGITIIVFSNIVVLFSNVIMLLK